MPSSYVLSIENRTRRLAYKLLHYGNYSCEEIMRKLEDFIFAEVLLNGLTVDDYFYLKSKVEEIYNAVID